MFHATGKQSDGTGKAAASDADLPPVGKQPVVPPVGAQPATASASKGLTFREVRELLPAGTEEGDLFTAWYQARSPGQGEDPNDTPALSVALILRQISNIGELLAMLTEFRRHRDAEAAHDPADEQNVAQQLHHQLSTSKLLSSARKLTLEEIQGSLRFLGEAEFTAEHRNQRRARNPNLTPRQAWGSDVAAASKMDGTGAFEANGTIFLRKGDADIHTAIHELLHKLSVPGLDAAIGHALAEGLTEHVALSVCQEAAIPAPDNAYPGERALLRALLNRYKLADQFMEIYLRDPALLADQLKASLGVDYARFIAEKSAVAASEIFKNARPAPQAEPEKPKGFWQSLFG